MAPPNSVALASPIPNTYFGSTYGSVAHFPSSFQWHGLAQPFIPSAHYDVDSTGRTLQPLPGVFGPPKLSPVSPFPTPVPMPPLVPHPVIPFPNHLGELVSWWTGHIRIIRDRFQPGIPEGGA